MRLYSNGYVFNIFSAFFPPWIAVAHSSVHQRTEWCLCGCIFGIEMFAYWRILVQKKSIIVSMSCVWSVSWRLEHSSLKSLQLVFLLIIQYELFKFCHHFYWPVSPCYHNLFLSDYFKLNFYTRLYILCYKMSILHKIFGVMSILISFDSYDVIYEQRMP